MSETTLTTYDTITGEVGPAIELVQQTREYIAAAKSTATRTAYRRDWRQFEGWCRTRGLQSMPARAEAIALYLTDRAGAGRKPSTLARALVAISQAHKATGHPSPTASAIVQETMKGIRRTLGTAPAQKAAISVEDLRAMVTALPTNLLGLRDRALLLVGFAGAFRRSELVALDLEDLRTTRDGLEVTIRRSKTDQEGAGRKIGIPYGGNPVTCPVRALKDWIDAAHLTTGPLFRSVNRHGRLSSTRLGDQAVARVVKRVAAAGLDAKQLAGHSLRAGLATAAARAGKAERVIAKQTGHKSMAVLRRYVRDGELWVENPAVGIGL